MRRLLPQILIPLIIFIFPAFPLDSIWVSHHTPYLHNFYIRAALRLTPLAITPSIAVIFTPYTIFVTTDQGFKPTILATLIISMVLQGAFWATIGAASGFKTWRYRFWHWRSRVLKVAGALAGLMVLVGILGMVISCLEMVRIYKRGPNSKSAKNAWILVMVAEVFPLCYGLVQLAGFFLLSRAKKMFPIPDAYEPTCLLTPDNITPKTESDAGAGSLARLFAEQEKAASKSEQDLSREPHTVTPEQTQVQETIPQQQTFRKSNHPKMVIHPWIKYWAVTVQVQRDKYRRNQTSKFQLVNFMASTSRYMFAGLFWTWVPISSLISLALEIFVFTRRLKHGKSLLCDNKPLCYFQLLRPLLGILWAFAIAPYLIRVRSSLVYNPTTLLQRLVRSTLLVWIPLVVCQLHWISLASYGKELQNLDPDWPGYPNDFMFYRARIVAIVIPGFAYFFLFPLAGFLAYSL
ncbi:hypothetical protein QBC38DRAFT_474041 [Podospora fimiseda]|uniref:Uncharacterized protein n=1 Tax=Podospora fimiseda TaxID=252190 RepID=A0AAN7BSR2_9PEZI|nr:hypothetical protein QBC38DRAFT_474041 [Podospora fimiseda]